MEFNVEVLQMQKILFSASISKMPNLENTGYFLLIQQGFFIFLPSIPSKTVTTKLINHTIF